MSQYSFGDKVTVNDQDYHHGASGVVLAVFQTFTEYEYAVALRTPDSWAYDVSTFPARVLRRGWDALMTG